MHSNSKDKSEDGVPLNGPAEVSAGQAAPHSAGPATGAAQVETSPQPKASPPGSPSAGTDSKAGEESQLQGQQLEKEARKLNLVGSSQLTRAVAEAVRRGLSSQFVFQESQLEGAVRAIGTELMARLKANSKSVRGLPKDAFLREVRADKKRIEAAREAARQELEAMLEKLKGVHDQVDQHEAVLVAESRATGLVQDEELSARIADIFNDLQSGADPATIRDKITALTLGSLQTERDRSIDAQMADHRGEVERFERRIAKLTSSLELTEDELKRIAAAKNIDLGVGSIYRTVQGLASGDNDYEAKKELMSCIFAANLELQKGHAEAG